MASLETYITRLIQGPPFKRSEEMQYEVLRLASFDKWPYWAVKRPMDLAQNGFYYSGEGDRVICFSCKGEISNWVNTDNVADQHSKRYPNCPFVHDNDDRNVVFKASSEGDETNGYKAPDTDCHSSREGSITEEHAASMKHDLQKQVLMSQAASMPVLAGAASTIRQESLGNSQSSMRELGNLLEELHSLPSVTEINDRVDTPSRCGPDPGTGRIDEIDPNFVKYESYRLRTFEGRWPASSFVSPVDLAKAGLYYVSLPDKVQCAFCKGRLLNWKPTDSPMGEHRRHYPECPFLQDRNVGNVPVEESLGTVQIPASQRSAQKTRGETPSERLGIMMDKPKHPDYAIEANRINSFKTWPKRTTLNPEALAKAGFFYVGYSDNVKCFFCDGGLRNWDDGDEPWREHARWFSRCGFLKMRQGEDYINSVLDETTAMGNSNTTQGVMAHVEKPQSSPPAANPIVPMESRELKARMDTPIVRTVIDMGFDAELVKKVLSNHFRISGDDFESAEQLLQAVFQEQEIQQKAALRQAEQAAEPQKPTTSRRKKRNRKKKKKGGGSEETQGSREEGAAGEVAESDNESETEETGEPEEAILHEDEEFRGLEKQYQRIKEERTCKICMDEECTIVFLPCGHLVCCSNCAPALRNCPICRQIIKGSVRMYTT